ncbi:unnamed protein product [Paramecium sonneborni]|uniref:G domain-containing protein n=1 Tax=Paramecium sonneborni TaxID=65129 RepID=A0A8S1L201_9CILI|nr:unnamed protein product [Paramecium sonneborni]
MQKNDQSKYQTPYHYYEELDNIDEEMLQLQFTDWSCIQHDKQKSQYDQNKKSDNINQFSNPTQFNQYQESNIKDQSKFQSQYNQGLQFKNKEQEQNEKMNEQKLLEIMVRFQKLIDQFNKNKKQNMSVVLIVGVTGSGKSTIFNFLSGADFIFNHKLELEVKNPSKNFSKMASGMNSITKEPNFYYNEFNNHLIIDFPGFQDTNGEQDQLLFELLFHKIVSLGPIKVIYVINNPLNSLPNRGSDLQEFINQFCLKGNIDIEKYNLFLNCYLENFSDIQLQNKIKEDLRAVNKLQSIDKILVLRKAQNNNELQNIFNYKQRQIVWKHIEQMQSIKIQSQKLPKSQMISDYLRNSITKTIEKYGIVLSEFFDNKFQQLSNLQNQTTIASMEKLLDLINKIDKESSFEWYTKYIQTCEQLAKSLSIQDDIVTRSNNFIQIFKYYSQFSNLIQGYDDLKILQIIAKDQLKNMNKLISQRLEILQTKEQLNMVITQQEENMIELNSIFENNIQEINSQIVQQDLKIKNYEQQIQQLQTQNKDRTSEIKLLSNQLEEQKKIKSALNQQQIQKEKQTQELVNKINDQSEQIKQMENRNLQLINLMNEQHQQQTTQMMNQIQNLQNREPQTIHHYHETTKWCQIF